MFLSKQISLAHAATYVGWALGVGTWIVSWIIGSDHLGQGALIVALVAAVATARLSAGEHARDLHNALTIVREVDGPIPLQRR